MKKSGVCRFFDSFLQRMFHRIDHGYLDLSIQKEGDYHGKCFSDQKRIPDAVKLRKTSQQVGAWQNDEQLPT